MYSTCILKEGWKTVTHARQTHTVPVVSGESMLCLQRARMFLDEANLHLP